jgi:hypothetical protein
MTALYGTPAWAEKYRPSLTARFLSGDDLTERSAWYIDQGDGKAKILTVEPFEEFQQVNADLRDLSSGKKWDDGLALAARVPMHIWQRQLAEAICQEDNRYISRWLNDPDHAHFRTKEGKV